MKAAVKRNKYVILLAVLILVQLIYFSYCFVYKKNGYHSDEIWSYGIANNATGPNVFKDNAGEVFVNNDKWISGDLFRDYIVVGEDERFSYGQVVKNASFDYHPPLSFVLLHTICSLFPDSYSQWYGFVLNIAAFIFIQVALFLWGRRLFESDLKALLLCVFYGFSLAALNTMMFVRMYGLAAAFTIISINCHYNIFINKECNLIKNLAGIFVATLLGALTLHLYLAFAFFISAMFCVWLLFSKQIKKMLLYITTMLSSVGISILMFPATIEHLFSVAGDELRQDLAPLNFDIRCGIGVVVEELFGASFNPYPSYFWIHVAEILLVVIVIALPIGFVCRNENWFNVFGKKVVEIVKNTVRQIKNTNWFCVIILAAVYFYIVVVAESIEIIQSGKYTNRYFMIVYPAVYGVVLYIIDVCCKMLHSWIGKKITGSVIKIESFIFKAILPVMSVVILLSVYAKSGCYYYFDFSAQCDLKLEDIADDADIVVTLREYWLMTCLAHEFRDCNQFYATGLGWWRDGDEMTAKTIEQLNTLESDGPIYWVTEPPYDTKPLEEEMDVEEYCSTVASIFGADNPENELISERMDELEEFVGELNFVNKITYVGKSSLFARTVFVYKIE